MHLNDQYPMTKVYQKLFPVILQLACDVERVRKNCTASACIHVKHIVTSFSGQEYVLCGKCFRRFMYDCIFCIHGCNIFVLDPRGRPMVPVAGVVGVVFHMSLWTTPSSV